MPFVAVLFTLGLQASKVRTGDWLGEQLTPGLLAIQNLRDVTIDLCLRAVRCDGGAASMKPKPGGGPRMSIDAIMRMAWVS